MGRYSFHDILGRVQKLQVILHCYQPECNSAFNYSKKPRTSLLKSVGIVIVLCTFTGLTLTFSTLCIPNNSSLGLSHGQAGSSKREKPISVLTGMCGWKGSTVSVTVFNVLPSHCSSPSIAHSIRYDRQQALLQGMHSTKHEYFPAYPQVHVCMILQLNKT